jgi:hypothetical protein
MLLSLVVAACYEEPVVLTTFSPTDLPIPTDTTDPGVTPTPGLVTTGVAADCVNGWAAPPDTSPEYGTGMYLIERQMEVVGPWTVDEMRHFIGPDVFWAETPAPFVERWYVKASLTNQDFRGRWLIEKRSDFDYGVVAVAPHDTTGYQAPDWTGFVGDGSPTTYLGLPGQWTGTPYDFVSGGGYNYEPGLPDEVIGCMSGT